MYNNEIMKGSEIIEGMIAVAAVVTFLLSIGFSQARAR